MTRDVNNCFHCSFVENIHFNTAEKPPDPRAFFILFLFYFNLHSFIVNGDAVIHIWLLWLPSCQTMLITSWSVFGWAAQQSLKSHSETDETDFCLFHLLTFSSQSILTLFSSSAPSVLRLPPQSVLGLCGRIIKCVFYSLLLSRCLSRSEWTSGARWIFTAAISVSAQRKTEQSKLRGGERKKNLHIFCFILGFTEQMNQLMMQWNCILRISLRSFKDVLINVSPGFLETFQCFSLLA